MDAEFSERLRVNLSEDAEEKITNDTLCFEGEKPKYNTALNKFFQSYFSLAKHDENTAKKFGSLQRSIADKRVPYMDTKTMGLLNNARKTIFDVYEGRAGRFIKSVIEQYASQHFLDREKAYFKETVETIENAIRHREKLKIQLGEKVFAVRPYKILNDKQSTFNYLIGFSSQNGVEAENIASMRLSRITSIKCTPDDGAISIYEIDKIRDKIVSSGVAFLIEDAIKVVVKLTKKGRGLYAGHVLNRPIYLSIIGNEYEFKCTKKQAEAYFFKFGADAEVIEPLLLREEFISKHKEALAKYTL